MVIFHSYVSLPEGKHHGISSWWTNGPWFFGPLQTVPFGRREVSIDNALILNNSRRWPLMIDPQIQAQSCLMDLDGDSLMTLAPFWVSMGIPPWQCRRLSHKSKSVKPACHRPTSGFATRRGRNFWFYDFHRFLACRMMRCFTSVGWW